MKTFTLLAQIVFFVASPLIVRGQLQVQCQLNNTVNSKSKIDEEILLEFRPIQSNIIVTEDRQEVIQLVVKEGHDVANIEGEVFYKYGKNDLFVSEQELIIYTDDGTNGDLIPNDGIFTTDDIFLGFEDWIETYWIRQLDVRLKFYDANNNLLGEDRLFLPYIVINPSYLNSVADFKPNYLTSDSSVIHIGNAVYVEFEKNIKKYIDPNRHFSANLYDEELWLEELYDSIWQESIFTFPGDGKLGLADLNSSVYSFPINGGSGNYYVFENKTGNTSMRTMFQTSTVVHELFHMFQSHFFRYFIDEVPEGPLYKIGAIAHNPVQFFGQSAFGLHYPLPIAYSNLCPEHFDALGRTENGYQITVTEPCDTTGLNLVNGIAENVHSNFELYIMDLIEVDELDFPLNFGFNPSKEPDPIVDFVTWKFDTLAANSKEQIIEMKDMWYNREGGRFKPYYDAKEKNMFVFFHGTGIPTYDELKALHMLSDELVSPTISMESPIWSQWGYADDIYQRYISYEQATLGLGRLFNNFPLPPGYSSEIVQHIDTISIYDTTYVSIYDTTLVSIYDTTFISVCDTLVIDLIRTAMNETSIEGKVKIYPNPTSDYVIVEFDNWEEFSDHIIEILNSNGSGVFDTFFDQNKIAIPIDDIGPPGTYFIVIQNENRENIFVKTLVLQ